MLTATKEKNLHIRATTEQKATLAEAARLTQQNVSQFVLAVSLTAAQQMLLQHQRTVDQITLSSEEYDAFIKRLDEAPRLIPALAEQFGKVTPFRD